MIKGTLSFDILQMQRPNLLLLVKKSRNLFFFANYHMNTIYICYVAQTLHTTYIFWCAL